MKDIIYCKKCGNQIIEEFGTCPYCKTPIHGHSNYEERHEHNNIRQTRNLSPDFNPNFNFNHKRNNSSFGLILLCICGIACLAWIFYKDGQGIIYSDNKSSTHITNFTPFIKVKNYQEIYNEYSKKLIRSGPSSSISEMADIFNEGIEKMAEYMYSATGTDGQYATYESWGMKLWDVYMENCR